MKTLLNEVEAEIATFPITIHSRQSSTTSHKSIPSVPIITPNIESLNIPNTANNHTPIAVQV